MLFQHQQDGVFHAQARLVPSPSWGYENVALAGTSAACDSNACHVHKMSAKEHELLKAKYKEESQERRELYNKIIELKG